MPIIPAPESGSRRIASLGNIAKPPQNNNSNKTLQILADNHRNYLVPNGFYQPPGNPSRVSYALNKEGKAKGSWTLKKQRK